mmetsp:Transcript_23525/g.39421  ORF Transcript_23525/g.39421 Transcript_23525/m.39421 type:complete len:126 (+) Transcript_23525:243-620(+)
MLRPQQFQYEPALVNLSRRLLWAPKIKLFKAVLNGQPAKCVIHTVSTDTADVNLIDGATKEIISKWLNFRIVKISSLKMPSSLLWSRAARRRSGKGRNIPYSRETPSLFSTSFQSPSTQAISCLQ